MKKINSKDKGKRGELAFIKAFYEASGVNLQRNYDQPASGGDDIKVVSPQSKLSHYLNENFSIEIKHYGHITPAMLVAFWQQACKQARETNKLPLLAYKQNYRDWRIVYPLMWKIDSSIDGTCEMSIDAAISYMEIRAND